MSDRICDKMGEVLTADPDVSCTTGCMRCCTFGGPCPEILDKPFPEWQTQVSKPCDQECVTYYFTYEMSFKGILCFALTVISQQYRDLEHLHVETRRVKMATTVVSPPIDWQSSTKPLSNLISDLLFALPSRCPLRRSTVPGCNTAVNVHMKPRLWSQLPIELVTKIVTMLPLQNLLPLRSVCKDWRLLACDPIRVDSIITPSNPASKDRTQASFPPIYICLLQNNQYGVYNPTSNAWNVLSHSFIPKYYPVTPFHRIVVANAVSLLLLRGTDHGSRFFFVVNPINKSERQLPALPQPRICMLRSTNYVVILLRCGAWIAVDKKTGDFQVLSVEEYVVDSSVEGRTEYINFLSIYDSRSDSWTLKCAPLPDLQSKRIHNIVIFQDHICCLVERQLPTFSPFLNNRYEVYRVRHRGWQQEDACVKESMSLSTSEDWYDMYTQRQKGWKRWDCDLPQHMYGAKLFVCGEVLMLATGTIEPQIMLLGGESYPSESCLLAVEIWTFSTELLGWVKFQTMPDQLLPHVSSVNPKFTAGAYLDDAQHYNIQINGAYVAVNNFHTNRTIMSDVSTRLWWLLPPQSSEVLSLALPYERTCTTSFLLEPSLEVP